MDPQVDILAIRAIIAPNISPFAFKIAQPDENDRATSRLNHREQEQAFQSVALKEEEPTRVASSVAQRPIKLSLLQNWKRKPTVGSMLDL